MYSFYGGKQGRTYHIVLRFDCVSLENFKIEFADKIKLNVSYTLLEAGDLVKQSSSGKIYKLTIKPESESDVFSNNAIEIKGMVLEFNKGGSYTTVNYGLYVIIDTVKNLGHYSNDENGLLFRRGFDYVPTATEKPQKGDYTDSNSGVHEQTTTFHELAWQSAWSNWVEDVGGGAIYVGQIVGPIGKVGLLNAVTWSDLTTINLGLSKNIDTVLLNVTKSAVDGTEILDNFWFGVALIKDSKGDITGHQISFDFLKPVVNIQATPVAPYGRKALSFEDGISSLPTNWYVDFELPTLEQSQENPANYSLIKEHDNSKDHGFYYSYQIAVPQGKKGDSVESLNIVNINQSDLPTTIDAPDGIQINNNYDYLTYKVTIYDNELSGLTSGNKYISPYNIIKQIDSKSKERTIILLKDDKESTSEDLQIGSLAKGTGENWNNLYLVCINKGNQLESFIPKNNLDPAPKVGDIYKDINNPNNSPVWQCIELPEDGVLDNIVIKFTASEDGSFTIRNIDYLYMDQYGNLFITYSDTQTPIKIGHIPILKLVSFNNFESSGDSKFYQTISTENSFNETEISDEINYPVDIRREGDVMYVLYSSETYRNNIQNNYKYFNYNNQSYKYKAFPLAPVGYHILGNVPILALVENGAFANGVLEYTITEGGSTFKPFEQNAGWVVSVEEGSNTILYAYDYVSSTPKYKIIINGEEKDTYWYPIENRNTEVDLTTYYIVDTLTVDDNDEIKPSNSINSQNLKINGIWFVI